VTDSASRRQYYEQNPGDQHEGELLMVHANHYYKAISQKIKFRNPVYLNDWIQIISRVDDIHDALGLVSLKLFLTNHRGEKVANAMVEIKIL